MIETIALITSATGVVIAFLAWRDKKVFARNSELNDRLDSIRADIRVLEKQMSEAHTEIAVTMKEQELTANILVSIENKIDQLEEKLWTR